MTDQPSDYKTAERLDSDDFYKLQLLNRTVDLFEAQLEIARLRILDAHRTLTEFSTFLGQKYGFTAQDQLNMTNGKIERNSQAKVEEVGRDEQAK